MSSWNTQYKSEDELLQAKANAMNRGQALNPDQTAGGWTPDKVKDAINESYGGSVDAWWNDAGKNEDM